MDRFSEKEADVSAEKAYADSGTFENMKDQKSPSADRNVKKKHTKKDAVVQAVVQYYHLGIQIQMLLKI